MSQYEFYPITDMLKFVIDVKPIPDLTFKIENYELIMKLIDTSV